MIIKYERAVGERVASRDRRFARNPTWTANATVHGVQDGGGGRNEGGEGSMPLDDAKRLAQRDASTREQHTFDALIESHIRNLQDRGLLPPAAHRALQYARWRQSCVKEARDLGRALLRANVLAERDSATVERRAVRGCAAYFREAQPQGTV